MIAEAIVNPTRVSERGPGATTGIAPRAVPWGFPEYFLVAQTAFPALLYLPGTQSLRLPLRIGIFALSLAALAWALAQRKHRALPAHPACRFLTLFALWLGVSVCNPLANSLLSAIAQVFLYVSVFAPVFWAPLLVRGERQLARLLWIMLICNGLNSCVGLLQVYDPDRWSPAELSSVTTTSEYGLDPYTYRGADGRRIVRPCGLFDTPGAVCGPASIAVLLGISLALTRNTPWAARLLAGGFGFCGLTAIWFTQVRTSLLIAVGMILFRVVLLLFHRRFIDAALLGGITWLTFALSFSIAAAVGGNSITNRFETLLQDSPEEVYYKAHRGDQLEDALTDTIWKYPLGAGPGRWGMMNAYFGDPTNYANPALWAELAIPGWILDGGFPGLILYLLALAATIWHDFRLARLAHKRGSISLATMIMAIGAGTYGIAFGFTPFTNQSGMQYWFLIGALHAAYMPRPARHLAVA